MHTNLYTAYASTVFLNQNFTVRLEAILLLNGLLHTELPACYTQPYNSSTLSCC